MRGRFAPRGACSVICIADGRVNVSRPGCDIADGDEMECSAEFAAYVADAYEGREGEPAFIVIPDESIADSESPVGDTPEAVAPIEAPARVEAVFVPPLPEPPDVALDEPEAPAVEVAAAAPAVDVTALKRRIADMHPMKQIKLAQELPGGAEVRKLAPAKVVIEQALTTNLDAVLAALPAIEG